MNPSSPGTAFSKVPRKILGKLLILGATDTQVATSSRGYSATAEHCSSSSNSSSKIRSFPKIYYRNFRKCGPWLLRAMQLVLLHSHVSHPHTPWDLMNVFKSFFYFSTFSTFYYVSKISTRRFFCICDPRYLCNDTEAKLSLGAECEPSDECADVNAYCTTDPAAAAVSTTTRCLCRPAYFNRQQRCGLCLNSPTLNLLSITRLNINQGWEHDITFGGLEPRSWRAQEREPIDL